MKYYRRFPGDYLRDTMNLTLEQHGAYTLLLDHYYATETPIPSVKAAYKICSAGSKRDRFAIHLVLSQFFEKIPNGGYQHSRVEKEISYADSISNVRKYAAEVRHKKRANAMQMQSKCNAIPDNQTTKDQKKSILKTGSITYEQSVMQEPMKGKSQSAAAPLFLPPAVSGKLWTEFEKMRNKIRKPMTAHAADLICRKLQGLEVRGENLTEVLQQSIRNDWQDVYPVRKDRENGTTTTREQLRHDTTQKNIEQALGHSSRLANSLRSPVPGNNLTGIESDLHGDSERHSAGTATPSISRSGKKE
jgi:uncharacterized protein YdaU (DUF1376 family)